MVFKMTVTTDGTREVITFTARNVAQALLVARKFNGTVLRRFV